MTEVAKPKRALENLGGRPSKLTEELLQEIGGYLKLGNHIDLCCEAVGIHRTQFYRWLAEGKEAKTGLKKKFRDVIIQANAIAEIRDIARIDKHGEKEWRALAWKLERRAPQRWGRRETVAVEQSGIGPVVIAERRKALLATAQDPGFREMLGKLAEALRPARDNPDIVDGEVLMQDGA